MSVERIEWQCPGCHRKFAIPSNQPRPKLCPHCQQTAQAVPRQPAPSPAVAAHVSPAIAEPEVEFAEVPVATPPLGGGASSPSPRPVKRRRYQELRTLSVVLKIMAGLIGFLMIGMLVENGRLVMETEEGDLRRYLVYQCLGTLIGGSTAVLLVYAFAVLLVVAADIEHNTRQD